MDIYETKEKINYYKEAIESRDYSIRDENFLINSDKINRTLRENVKELISTNIDKKLCLNLKTCLSILKKNLDKKDEDIFKMPEEKIQFDKKNLNPIELNHETSILKCSIEYTSSHMTLSSNIPKTPPDLIKYREKYRLGVHTSSFLNQIPSFPGLSDRVTAPMLDIDSLNRTLLNSKPSFLKLSQNITENTMCAKIEKDVEKFSNHTTHIAKQKLHFSPPFSSTVMESNKENGLKNGFDVIQNKEVLTNKEPLIPINKPKNDVDFLTSIMDDESCSFFQDSKAHSFLNKNSILVPEKIAQPMNKRKSRSKKVSFKQATAKKERLNLDSPSDIKLKNRRDKNISIDLLNETCMENGIASGTNLTADNIFGEVIITPGFNKSFQKLRKSMGKDNETQFNINLGKRRSSRNLNP